MKTPIFGSAYTARSSNLADNRLINLYQEVVETKSGGKSVGALMLCPGLDLLANIGSGPVRAMLQANLSGTDHLYLVSGDGLYQLDTAFNATLLGTLGGDNGAPSLINNGVGIGVFLGSRAYQWSPVGGFAAITLPFTAAGSLPITAAELDGFAVANQPGSDFWFQSGLKDLSTWNALNFAEASGEPDNVRAIAALHREFVLFKEKQTEFWYDAGTSGFAFARIDGVYLEAGISAVASLRKLGEGLCWLGQTAEGDGIALELMGHKHQRISNHAVETEWQKYSTLADAVGYTYQQAGHEFYVLNFPTADTSWVYDRTASLQLKEACWHQRARWDTSIGQFRRHIGQCSALFNHQVVVGDASNGNIYAYNPEALLDNSAARKWLRTWRALPKPVPDPVSFFDLRIDMETGSNQIAQSLDPRAVLRWSDDGGHTWSNERQLAVGKVGQTAFRVRCPRMGSTRRNSGLDRIFELSATDAFPVRIVDAEVEAA
jgi:hypothetical protein